MKSFHVPDVLRLPWWPPFCLAVAAQALVSCSGGEGETAPDVPSGGFVSIEQPTTASRYVADGSALLLQGEAFISPTHRRCCTGSATDTGVTVSWANANSGEAGSATQRPVYCVFIFQLVLCDHEWEASVPLVMGSNIITVRAFDPDGRVGSATLVVMRVPDATPPRVSSTSPLNGAVGIAVETPILAIFSERIDPATIDSGNFSVRDAANNPVVGDVTGADNQATFTPVVPLASSTAYTATVGPGVKDLTGLVMQASHTWSFTTGLSLWQRLSLQNAPSPRTDHTSVWTGTHLIVWGGRDGIGFLPTGGSIDPDPGFWESTATPTAPTGRSLHTAVWSGSEMIVWGGFNGGYLNDGGRLNPLPSLVPWRSVSSVDAPGARARHTAVWTGSEMIVWGGEDSNGRLSTGARYTPSINSWQAVVDGPPARALHSAIWTGAQMIIWGGADGSQLVLGGAGFIPATNVWRVLSSTGAPSPRASHTAVWTGTEMIIWGGWNNNDSAPIYFSDGVRYSPQTDTWTPLAMAGAPSPRAHHTAVWTGSEMIVWGGADEAGRFNTGGRYNPSTNTWAPVSMATAPDRRMNHTAHWTGAEMLVWGGVDGASLHNTGGRYQP